MEAWTYPATHRHYKGGLYLKLADATDEATGDPVVVYQSCQDGRVWVRRRDDFEATVIHEGRRVPRFASLMQEGRA